MSEPEDRPRTEGEIQRTSALAKVKTGERGIMIAAMDDLKEFAETAVKAGVAPKGMGIGAAMMAIQAGLERGLAPLGGLQAAVVINGVLSWRGWAGLAMMRQSGLVLPGTLKSWVDGDLDGPKANAVGYATAQRVGYKEAFVRQFSVSDAKKAGLWNKGGPWQTRPGNMLEWRALGDLIRFHFPEIMGGIPIAEDVEAGGVGPEVTVIEEGPQERAKRPAPKVADPVLAQIVEGDASGVPAEPLPPEPGPEDAGGAEAPTAPEPHVAEPTTGSPFPVPEVEMPGDARGWKGGPGDLPAEERREAERRSGETLHPNATGAVVEKREAPRRAGDGLVSVMTHAGGEKAKATPCPRCGEQDSGFALYGECGVCNYPEAEPGD